MKLRLPVLLVMGLTLAACSETTAPEVAEPPVEVAFGLGHHFGFNGLVAGGGHYLFGGTLDIRFSMAAIGKADGSAIGLFHQAVDLGGTTAEFLGRVTCLAIDKVNGRAWIGGVVLANRSTDPAFLTPINEVGRDVWFRVLDDESIGDRSTFLGFEGGAGIITSEQYCSERPWPDNNDRTHPVTSGNIEVKLK
jgi:hypothetical protein